MKILMLNYEFPPIGGGGGQAHQALLAQYAGREGLAVDVLTSAPKPGLVVEQVSDNITIRKVGIHKKELHLWRRSEVLEWLVKAKPQYRRMLGERDYDLVHAFFGFPTGWLCYRTARRLPYIISLRGSDVPGANARLKFEYKLLGPLAFKPIWQKAAALIACSEGLKRRALEFLPSAQIEVIPNGVDLTRFRPASASPRDRRPGEVLRLLTVGRLSATKRVPMLLDTLSLLCKSGCNARLTIVGGGALESELHEAVHAKGLADVVTLAGRCEADQVPAIYQEHDVLVTASMQEGMSNAMLEAMASALPIVTTPCEGVEELIGDNGVVVKAATPDALAQALRTLADDAQVWASMSIAARRQAERFAWSRTAQQYLDLYARVT
jgi:glycosyltransferase involved in cell wall biosynthesis